MFYLRLITLFVLILLSACTTSDMLKTKSGLELVFIEKGNGKSPKNGQYIIIDLTISNSSDSVVYDTYKTKMPESFLFYDSLVDINGGIYEIFRQVGKGDSLQVSVVADSLYKDIVYPSGVTQGETIKLNIKVSNVLELGLFRAWRVKRVKAIQEYYSLLARERNRLDSIALGDFMNSHQKTPLRLDNGVYVEKLNSVKSRSPSIGDRLQIKYRAKILNGTVFEDNFTENTALSFTLGANEVIRGLDEGIRFLNEGEEAIIYIPSLIAYGESDLGGKIPPFSILVYEVKLVKIERLK